MALKFLIVEGNTRDARMAHKAAYGSMPCESYAAVLQAIEKDAVCEFAFPADEGANLPDPAGLSSYDGVVLTGSALNLYDRTPAVNRQIDLMRAVFASRVPAFGSCWGIQVAAAAAGGDVRRNPKGLEIGFARRLTATQAGRVASDARGQAARLRGAGDPPRHCRYGSAGLHASSPRMRLAEIQAAEIRSDGGTFWGVQYHPEFSLRELAVILERRVEILVGGGFCDSLEDAAAYVADLIALDAEPRPDLAWRHGLDEEVLDPARRTREIRNFISKRVKPVKSVNGRA